MKLVVIFFIIFFIVIMDGYSQGICIISLGTTYSLKGRVVAPHVENGIKGEIVVPDAIVELKDDYYTPAHIIAKVKTDKEGHFKFKNIKSGKYVISVTYLPFFPLAASLQFINNKKEAVTQDTHKEIVIAIGTSDKPCGGGYAELKDLGTHYMH